VPDAADPGAGAVGRGHGYCCPPGGRGDPKRLDQFLRGDDCADDSRLGRAAQTEGDQLWPGHSTEVAGTNG